MSHNHFDQGARYVAKLDPPGILCWLLRLRADQLLFRHWLDTRGIPFPGEPDYVCDTVGFVEDVQRGQVPWAMILEFQLTPDALMFGRFLVYGGQIWLERKPSEERGDRFCVGAVCVNLTGRGSTAREMRWPEAGLAMVLQPREVNLCDEDAPTTLKAIEAGEVTRAALAFIPLMQGGSDSGNIQLWLSVAAQEPDARLRSAYAGLALIFAEATGCHDAWKQATKGWNMVQSQQVLEWQAEARAEARAECIVRVLEVRFQTVVPQDLASAIRSVTEMNRLVQWLDTAASCVSLDDFRQTTGL